MYNAQICSALEYASLSWMDALTTTLSVLDRIQKKALDVIGINYEARSKLKIPLSSNQPPNTSNLHKPEYAKPYTGRAEIKTILFRMKVLSIALLKSAL